jgi:hypothetical protein
MMYPRRGEDSSARMIIFRRAGYEDSVQNAGVSIQNNSCKPNSPAIHCPEKSFCVAQNEANRRLHFVSVVKKMW